MKKKKKILLVAEPHGFCGGVRRALELVNAALAAENGPVYVLRELVHNRTVHADLVRRGVIFVSQVSEVPPGARLIAGAHGTPPAEAAEAAARQLRFTDAVCPLVQKLERAAEAVSPDRALILIGHASHPEVRAVLARSGTPAAFTVATLAEAEALPDLLPHPLVLTQTTFQQEERDVLLRFLKRRYPDLEEGPSVCYATFERQQAVRLLAGKCRFLLVIGSAQSSNSQRLAETGRALGMEAHLIENSDALSGFDWSKVESVGITAGASAPEELVESTVLGLTALGFEKSSASFAEETEDLKSPKC